MDKLENLVDDSGIFLTTNAIKAGFDKTTIYNFLKKNDYEQISHGIHLSPNAWSDDNYILSLRCPNAIFSHDEALYFHGLIDREPFQKTITVYTGYGRARLNNDGVKVFSVKKELLEIGKITITNSFGHKIPIYDLERTICDLIRCKSQFEIQDYTTALKSYSSRKDKNLNKLMKYAKLFNIDRKVREYMEVLL